MRILKAAAALLFGVALCTAADATPAVVELIEKGRYQLRDDDSLLAKRTFLTALEKCTDSRDDQFHRGQLYYRLAFLMRNKNDASPLSGKGHDIRKTLGLGPEYYYDVFRDMQKLSFAGFTKMKIELPTMKTFAELLSEAEKAKLAKKAQAESQKKDEMAVKEYFEIQRIREIERQIEAEARKKAEKDKAAKERIEREKFEKTPEFREKKAAALLRIGQDFIDEGMAKGLPASVKIGIRRLETLMRSYSETAAAKAAKAILDGLEK